VREPEKEDFGKDRTARGYNYKRKGKSIGFLIDDGIGWEMARRGGCVGLATDARIFRANDVHLPSLASAV
jgi:hypothetical protein